MKGTSFTPWQKYSGVKQVPGGPNLHAAMPAKTANSRIKLSKKIYQ